MTRKVLIRNHIRADSMSEKRCATALLDRTPPTKNHGGGGFADSLRVVRLFFTTPKKSAQTIVDIPSKVVAYQCNSRVSHGRKLLWRNVVTRARKGAAPAKTALKRAAEGGASDAAEPSRTAGDQLRDDLGHRGDSLSVTLLIRQAARVADRLEHIDALLAGRLDSWATVSLPKPGSTRGKVIVEVKVDGLLVEERSQTTLYRHLLGEIARMRGGLPPAPGGDGDDDLVE